MIGGSPSGVHAAAAALRAAGSDLDSAGAAVGSHGESVTSEWFGDASAAAGEAIHRLRTSTYSMSDAVADCEGVYATYGDELAAAQAAWAAGDEQRTAGEAGQRSAATAAMHASDRPADDLGRDDAVTAARTAHDRATVQAEAGRTAMADAVAREAAANERAARSIDAIVERLEAVATAHPAVYGPPGPYGPPALVWTGAGGTMGPPGPMGPPVPRSPEEPEPPQDEGMSASDWGHLTLDGAGFIPGVGIAADLVNAGWYLAEGDYVDAAFSGTAAVPIVGDGVAAGRLAYKGARAGRAAEKAIEAERVARAAAASTPPARALTPAEQAWADKMASTHNDVADTFAGKHLAAADLMAHQAQSAADFIPVKRTARQSAGEAARGIEDSKIAGYVRHGVIAERPGLRVDPLTGRYVDPRKGLTPEEWTAEFGPPAKRGWPEQDGFRNGVHEPSTAEVGQVLDRLGDPTGRYLAPEGTPLEKRSLSIDSYDDAYHRYKVIKPLPSEVRQGIAGPAFNHDGGGTQYFTNTMTVEDLVNQGYLKELS